LSLSTFQTQHLILDKGCLDTLFFRSKTYVKKQNSLHPPIITNLLHNIHQMLQPEGSQTNNETVGSSGEGCNDTTNTNISGVYFLITPRPKIKAIRDFNGFQKPIQRIRIDHGLLEKSTSTNSATRASEENHRHKLGRLVQRGQSHIPNKQTASNSSRSQLKSSLKPTSSPPVYIFLCTRNDNYTIGKDPVYSYSPANGTHSALTPTTNTIPKTPTTIPPNDRTTCPKCHMSFLEFRRGKPLQGKGIVSWVRRWNGHCTHCRTET